MRQGDVTRPGRTDHRKVNRNFTEHVLGTGRRISSIGLSKPGNGNFRQAIPSGSSRSGGIRDVSPRTREERSKKPGSREQVPENSKAQAKIPEIGSGGSAISDSPQLPVLGKLRLYRPCGLPFKSEAGLRILPVNPVSASAASSGVF